MMLSAPGVPGAVVSIDIPYITGEVVAATS
jgi:hypothetical protein